MTETIQTAMDRLMTISVEPQDYVAEDGLLYCGSCKTPKEAFFPNGKKLFGRDRHPAECRCRQATREKQEKEERARLHYEKVQRLKLQGFTDWAMQHWTFANDHGKNPQMQLAQRYVAHWPEMREKNVGLLLWGGVGTGKSFMAGCIANALMEQEVAVCMTNFARIMSNQGIADRLNAKKVPSPAARKLQSGAKLSLHFRKSDEPPWSAKAVDRILHNEVYIGKLVQGKTRRLDYRSKKKMNVPMRDWVIVDNTHEAIIPAEQFELVRRILETETRRPNNAETVALFAGFLYCGDCGSRLVRRSASYKGKRYIYYQCSGSKQNKGSCTSHNLRDEKLYNIVRNALQMQIQIVMEEAEFVESIRQAQQEPYRVRRIERQIRQLTAEKAHTQGIKEKLYGDYAEKILTREDFLNYNELYSKRIEEYNRKITELEAEQRNLQTAPNAYPFLDVYRKYRKLEEITRPMIVELIEKIEVYEGNRVEITFRFQDEIADLLEELHQKQMGQHEVSA